jgi:uncharacterized membrane protein
MQHAANGGMYHDVAAVLRNGFRIAAGLMITGIVLALIRQEPLSTKVDPITDIPNALLHLHSSAFIDLAIISIMLTPLASVFAILRSFVISADRRFAAYTAGVLIILSASIALSLLR